MGWRIKTQFCKLNFNLMGMTFSVGGDKGAHSDCFTQFWTLNLFFPHTLIYTCPPQVAWKRCNMLQKLVQTVQKSHLAWASITSSCKICPAIKKREMHKDDGSLQLPAVRVTFHFFLFLFSFIFPISGLFRASFHETWTLPLCFWTHSWTHSKFLIFSPWCSANEISWLTNEGFFS